MDKSLKQKINNTHKSVYSAGKSQKLAKSGLYEAWFTMFTDQEHHEAYWIRYTLLYPHRDFKNKIHKQALLWFGYFNIYDPDKNFMIKKFFPFSDVKGTTQEYYVKIKDSYLSYEDMKGKFSTHSGKEVVWNLQFSNYQVPYIATPKLSKLLGMTNTLSYATHPNFLISGTITIDNIRKEISQCRAIQYHTFGDAYTIPWEWFNCHTFQFSENAYMDFGYKVNKGVIEFFDGEHRITKWNKNIISKLLTIKKINRKKSLTQLEFSIEKGKVRIEGKVSVPEKHLIAVEYLGPRGNRFYCYNSAISDLKLKVIRNKEEKTYKIDQSVAFETVYKKPIENITYLPWESEELE